MGNTVRVRVPPFAPTKASPTANDPFHPLGKSTTTGAVKTANDAVDTAQAAVNGTVPSTLDSATSALTTANGTLTTAKATVTSATSSFTSGFAGIPDLTLTTLGVPAGTTADQYLALAPAVQTALDAATAANLSTLATAVKTAEAAVQTAQAVVDTLQALVTALTNLLNAVLGALTGDTDPLAALGNIKVATSAVAAKVPTADATVTVGSINVLGSKLNGVLFSRPLRTVVVPNRQFLDSVIHHPTFKFPGLQQPANSVNRKDQDIVIQDVDDVESGSRLESHSG